MSEHEILLDEISRLRCAIQSIARATNDESKPEYLRLSHVKFLAQEFLAIDRRTELSAIAERV